MVSPRLRLWLYATLMLVLLVGSGVAWLGWSSSGAHWVVATGARLLPGTLAMDRVEGRLADRLTLTGIDYRVAGTRLQVRRVELRWQPLGLLRGEVWIARLGIDDPELTLPPAAAPKKRAGDQLLPGLAWPRVSGWPLLLRARVDHLQVTGLLVRSGTKPSFALQKMTGKLSWRGGTLRAKALDLVNADARLRGGLTIALVTRRAEAQLTFTPVSEGRLASVPGGRVRLTLREGGDEVFLRGGLEAAAAWGAEPQLHLAGEFELHQNELRLTRLLLTRQGLAGQAQGTGRVTARAGRPAFDLDLQLSDVDLRPETRFPTAISGTLQGRVDGSGYAGSFQLANRDRGWRELKTQGRFAGDAAGIGLDELHAGWLGGGVRGKLHIDWKDVPFLTADLEGEDLDPGRLAGGWPGKINLHLQGRMDFPGHSPLQARWQAQIAPSRLRGFDLQGVVDGRYDGATLQLERLRLHGPGITLTARGELAQRLDVALHILDLGKLDAAASGEGEVQGWLRWQAQEGWAAAGRGHGRNLAYGPWQIKNLEAQGEWLPEQNRLNLSLTAADLSRGAWRAKNLQLAGEGRLDHHELALTARWAQGRLALQLAGGWRDGAWQGQLTTLTAADAQYGHWQLRQPVDLDLGGKRLAWSSLILQGDHQERLASSGALDLAPLDGGLELETRHFSLGWLSPWLAAGDLAGTADSHMTLRWNDGRLTLIEGTLAGQGSWSRAERQVAVRRLEAKVNWARAGLEGTWLIDLGPQGRCNGAVQSHRQPQLAFPERGVVDAHWQEFDLALLDPWLKALTVAGHLSGSAQLKWQEDRSLTLHLSTNGQSELTLADTHLALSRAQLALDWDAAGLRGRLDLADHSGGRLGMTLQSAEPAHYGWPTRGSLSYTGEGIDLALARPWLPSDLRLEGDLSLRGQGEWQPGGSVAASGQVAIKGGGCTWRRGGREFYARLQTAQLDWRWAGEALETELQLELGARGTVHGRLRLPLPARLPVRLAEQGALQGSLDGRFQEDGLLGGLFPGMIQESKGELQLKLAVDGSWTAPRVTGSAVLSGAGAYLPATGVRLQDATLRLRLTGDRLVVEELKVRSGSGVLHGSGELALHNLTPGAYRLALKGEGVQAIHLPELELTVSPDLEIAGRGRRLEVSGTLLVPEALFRGRQGKEPLTSSPDLVIIDAPATEETPLALAMSLKITVRLGDHVLVKAEGLDARLRGEVEIQGSDLRSLHGRGKIEVAEGNYSAYGVKLAITRGTAVFAGGPVAEPALDILALRQLEEVKAGVRVVGTPRAPEVHLYSEPAMPDTDVLAYIVLGHPLGGDSSQAGLMMAAAGALLSKGDSAVLQDRLKRQLGLDVISVETGKGNTAGSVVTIGKYLSPRLYISFGQSVFSNTSQVGVRYQLGHHWQVESSMGSETGADLYYRITFE
jgi:translocation and assembly module TamB